MLVRHALLSQKMTILLNARGTDAGARDSTNGRWPPKSFFIGLESVREERIKDKNKQKIHRSTLYYSAELMSIVAQGKRVTLPPVVRV
jgi:hypothetical protein